MGATGLSAEPAEYRRRLTEQSDEQLDAWTQELMRDLSIRRGVVKVLADFRRSAELSEPELERVFAAGGGAPSTIGRDGQGRLMVPAVALWALVPGLRAQVPDARDRLVSYLVESFGEVVYV